MGCVQWGELVQNIELKRLETIDRVVEEGIRQFNAEVRRLEQHNAEIERKIAALLRKDDLGSLSTEQLQAMDHEVRRMRNLIKGNQSAIVIANKSAASARKLRTDREIGDNHQRVHKVHNALVYKLNKLGVNADSIRTESQLMVDNAADETEETDDDIDVPDASNGVDRQALLDRLKGVSDAMAAIEPVAQRPDLSRLAEPPSSRPVEAEPPASRRKLAINHA